MAKTYCTTQPTTPDSRELLLVGLNDQFFLALLSVRQEIVRTWPQASISLTLNAEASELLIHELESRKEAIRREYEERVSELLTQTPQDEIDQIVDDVLRSGGKQ